MGVQRRISGRYRYIPRALDNTACLVNGLVRSSVLWLSRDRQTKPDRRQLPSFLFGKKEAMRVRANPTKLRKIHCAFVYRVEWA